MRTGMNYIIIDLEWNQCPRGPEFENPRIPFEIIEIGAIKLNESFEIVDEYSSIVKPRIYKHLHKHVRLMLNYDESYLKSGRPFDMVCREFMSWCGNDYTFGTWGTTDLVQLQKNMDYYYMNKFTEPFKYYDIQSIFADYYHDLGSCRLERAVTAMNLPKDEAFHSAINDARYTARIFQLLSKKHLNDQYTYDYYHEPKDKQSEIFSFHRTYSEHITRGFEDRADIMEDKEIITFRCYKCRRKIPKKIKWFSYNQHSFVGVGKCFYHGYQKGIIKIKTSNNGKIFAIKKVMPISKPEVEDVYKRQLELREKRREKRNSHKG